VKEEMFYSQINFSNKVGKSGTYNLIFSFAGNANNVASKVLDFFYQNEYDFLEHKVELHKEKVRIFVTRGERLYYRSVLICE
jgi:hypothetical protein